MVMTPDLEIEGAFTCTLPNGEAGSIRSLSPGPDGGWNATTTGNSLVQFDRQGNPFGPVISLSKEEGSTMPFSLATLEDGRIVVSDRSLDRLRVIDPANPSSPMREIGEPGSWDGALWWPGEIQPFSEGRVVVVDQGNHRAQVFDPNTGEWSMTFSLGMAHDRPMLFKEDFEPETEEGS